MHKTLLKTNIVAKLRQFCREKADGQVLPAKSTTLLDGLSATLWPWASAVVFTITWSVVSILIWNSSA